jgi:hypothetical protein
MSIWDWVREYREQALDDGDDDRLRMTLLLSQASPFERDPDRALQLLEEGRTLARALGEQRWVLFFTHWRLQVLFYYKGDYSGVLEEAIQATVNVSKPSFADFPQRVCLQEDLITACLKVDPLGYHDQIEQSLAYMQKEVAEDMECRYCVLNCRSEFEFACGRYDTAQEAAMQGVSMAEDEGDRHQIANGYLNACIAAFAAGDFDSLTVWATAGEEAARQIDRKQYLLQFLMWQAVICQRSGDANAARALVRSAASLVMRLPTPPDEAYYAALCAYLLLVDGPEKALMARDRELEGIAGKNQLDRECRVLIERCRLLTQLGRRTAADLETARTAARKMRKPEKYLADIDQIAAGS